MKQLILLCTVILFCSNLSAQKDDIYYSQLSDTTKVVTEKTGKVSPGSWLIISAKRQMGGYFCYGFAMGITYMNTYIAIQSPTGYNAKPLSLISGVLVIFGTGMLISSVTAKRRAGQALNDLSLDFKTTSDGLTLSFKL